MAAVLAIASQLPAGTLYYVEGTFAPSFVNQGFEPFSGTMEFSTDTVNTGLLKLEIDSETPLVRETPFAMTLDLPGSETQPWDTRMYTGIFKSKPMTMLSLDYDQQAGLTTSSDALLNGGGWDSWTVSFPDYPAGSFSYLGKTPQVNEPTAAALAVVGFVMLLGMAREARRHC